VRKRKRKRRKEASALYGGVIVPSLAGVAIFNGR
jgi:hypothetical protein